MKGKISVVIPIYNVEDYLEECLQSVVRQTYEDLQIILVDDGSADQCPALCDAWAKKDARIQVIHQKNSGLAAARNSGLAIAKGDFIAFVDSDDVIAENMLYELLKMLLQEQADIADCGFISFKEKTMPEGAFSQGISDIRSYDTESALACLLDENPFHYTVWNKLYQRRILESLRFEDGKKYEDVFFTWQAFGLSRRVAKTSAVFYGYRQRSGSIMNTAFSLRILESLEGRLRQYAYIRQNFPKLAGKAQAQVLGNCLYLGQKALREADPEKAAEAVQKIASIYKETYADSHLQVSGKQKIWYQLAERNFSFCCRTRNMMGIGL